MTRRAGLFRLSAAALGVAALGGGGYFAWKKTFGKNSDEPEYLTGTVQRADIEDLVSGTGSLQPRDYVDVGAQVSGQLKKIHIDIGSEVRAGDLLAEIDPEQYTAKVDAIRAQLRNYEAQMLEREAQLAQAEQTFQRQKNLKAEDATTADTLLSAETALRVARAQINSLRAQMDQTASSLRVEEANLKYANIYAPMSGTVVSISARQGQTLNANQQAPTVLRLADLSTVTVQTQVSEADVGRLWPDMPAYFTTLGSRGRRWTGRLRKIEPTPTVQNNVVLYNALFDVANPNQELMTQMTAQVFFVAAAAADALVVPMSALTLSRGGNREGRGDRRRPRGEASSASAVSAPQPADKAAPSADQRASKKVDGEAQPLRQRPSAEGGASTPARSTDDRPQSWHRKDGQAGPDGEDTSGAPGLRRMRPSEAPETSASEAARDDHGAWRQRRERATEAPPDGQASRQADAASAPASAPWPRNGRGDDGAHGDVAPNPRGADQARQRHADEGGKRLAEASRDGARPNQARQGTGGRRGSEVVPRTGTVKVVDDQGQVHERQVTVGIANRVQAQVLSGLKEGERIVVGIKRAEPAERKNTSQGGAMNMQGGMPPGVPGGMGNGRTTR